MILNMITTGAMVRIGKTYGNRMIDLRPTNEKLRLRSRRILRELAGIDDDAAGRSCARRRAASSRPWSRPWPVSRSRRRSALLEQHGGQVRAAASRGRAGDER